MISPTSGFVSKAMLNIYMHNCLYAGVAVYIYAVYVVFVDSWTDHRFITETVKVQTCESMSHC